MGALPISMSRYMIDQRRAAQKAGQARPDTATLKSQYNQTFGKPTGTSTFQGDTSVPNMNTIGAPAPAGGMPPAGPGPGLMGGVAAPGTSNMPNAAPPPGFTFKKGGKVKAKKMASGGVTSKSSSASRRGDGIAQRGKTKGRMV